MLLLAEPLSPEELELKEQFIEEGFPDWSRRDFQQFIRGLEAHGWYEPHDFHPHHSFFLIPFLVRDADADLLAEEVQEKTADEIKKYYKVFKEDWKFLAGTSYSSIILSVSLTVSTEASRIEARIAEGEAKRSKRENLEYLLAKKITSVHYPMQELELNYPTTKGKVYSEEEDRYLLCRLWHYGMHMDDAFERIKKDITEFPVFRFDWFFKSRSPQELQRRCNTLLGMIEKEEELRQSEEAKSKPKGKVNKCVSVCFLGGGCD
jgi:SWI/SNF-related matrix-associated actin-dependent regulator of chromatin subfamily A member 5